MTDARFRRLAHELRERIALGDVGESGALESEAALGARYGVSRVTVRRALELLRAEGLVGSRRGAGWFVTSAAFHQQLALGTFRHAASAVADAGKQVRRHVVGFGYATPPAVIATALHLADGEEALWSRSLRTVDAVALDLVAEWVPAAVAGSISRDDAERSGIWETLQRGGRRVETVRQTIAAGVATDEDGRELAVTPGAPLLLVRRLALAEDGTPLALSDHRYLAHRFSLEVEFRGWSTGSPAEPPGLRTIPTTPTTPTEETP